MSGLKKIPVILDTDIGSDIDDTWALAMLLRSPELDLKLALSATSEPEVRARLLARLLETAGRTEVPVGVGVDRVAQEIRHREWVQAYDLSRYAGKVHRDGVGALIDTILGSSEPVTLICIGPLPNIADALRRAPQIAGRTNFVGMHGSVYRGYNGAPEVSKEWNVVSDPSACQAVFTAPWKSMVITPLDTCGLVKLTGERYRKVRASKDPLPRAVIENYDIWRHGADDGGASSILFDTVAVYLAFARSLLEVKRLGIRVTDDGFTVPDEQAQSMDVAIGWRGREAFEDLLMERLG